MKHLFKALIVAGVMASASAHAGTVASNFNALAPGSTPATLTDGGLTATFTGQVEFFRNGPFYRNGSNRAFSGRIDFNGPVDIRGWARGSAGGEVIGGNASLTPATTLPAGLTLDPAVAVVVGYDASNNEIARFDAPNVSFRDVPSATAFFFSGVSAIEVLELSGNTYAAAVLGEFTASAVPVPAAVWLLGSGLAGVFATGRRRVRVS